MVDLLRSNLAVVLSMFFKYFSIYIPLNYIRLIEIKYLNKGYRIGLRGRPRDHAIMNNIYLYYR